MCNSTHFKHRTNVELRHKDISSNKDFQPIHSHCRWLLLKFSQKIYATGKMGNKERLVTCFAITMQNVSKSDVPRFTTHGIKPVKFVRGCENLL